MSERPAIAAVMTRTHGRVLMAILCPFCGTTTRAYLWSLAGSGKRCPREGCGAVHHAKSATHVFTEGRR